MARRGAGTLLTALWVGEGRPSTSKTFGSSDSTLQSGLHWLGKVGSLNCNSGNDFHSNKLPMLVEAKFKSGPVYFKRLDKRTCLTTTPEVPRLGDRAGRGKRHLGH